MKAIRSMVNDCSAFFKYSNPQTKVGVLMFRHWNGIRYAGVLNMSRGMYKSGYKQGAFERDWHERHVL